MNTCVNCKETKQKEAFKKCGWSKITGERLYRNLCKKCYNAKYMPPTGKLNTGRYKKGHIPENPFKKGHATWNKGKKWPQKMRDFLANLQKGRKQTPESIEKRRLAAIKTWDKKRIGFGRNSAIATRWSKDVRKRDNYTCQHCNNMKDKVHAHHILPWNDNEMLRFDLSNGITLCVPCHMKMHHEEKTKKTPWNKGKKLSVEHRNKLSESHKGKTLSPEHRNNLKGKIPWNKGMKYGSIV